MSKPSLLGYYRLLLGFSQKEFYRGILARFVKLENDGVLTNQTSQQLPDLCESLIESSWLLVNGLPDISQDILKSLTLLTLGPQFRGSRNVNLGSEANRTVFALIKSIISTGVREEGLNFLEIINSVGRIYRIEFAPDPDIAIRQKLQDGSFRNRIAIEIKGGTDFSNIHNRLGEAEFWTVINVSDIEPKIWKQETPTTNELFYLEKIADMRSAEYERFKEYLISILGL
jgi:hypothetical protein